MFHVPEVFTVYRGRQRSKYNGIHSITEVDESMKQ